MTEVSSTATTKARRQRSTVKLETRTVPKIPKSIGLLSEHGVNSETHKVEFEYFNPTAGEVFVAGSFNNWEPRATPLIQQRGGKWSADLLLKPGRYEYRFVVDGQWQDDPMAAHFVANPFGSLNCVREV